MIIKAQLVEIDSSLLLEQRRPYLVLIPNHIFAVGFSLQADQQIDWGYPDEGMEDGKEKGGEAWEE